MEENVEMPGQTAPNDAFWPGYQNMQECASAYKNEKGIILIREHAYN